MKQKQWTKEEQYQLSEKLKRTLADDLVDELTNNFNTWHELELLERIAATHEEWEVFRDEMAAARYTLSMKTVPALKEQIAKMQELLKQIDECTGYCPHCDGAGYFPRGPYQDECETCLGYAHTVRDMRGLLAALVDVFVYLHPDKPVVTELHDPYEED